MSQWRALFHPVLINRAAKTVIIGSLAVFGLLVAFNNITDYASNFTFVRHTLSMDTTFPGNALKWRAISSPLLWHGIYGFIIVGEALTGLIFACAALQMARAIRADAVRFGQACALVPSGTALGFPLLFFGLSVVCAEWFVLW